MINSYLKGFTKDIKEFSEKEMYSTAAILVLEYDEELFKFPLEAISLILSIKRYKRCVPLSTLEILEKTLTANQNIVSLNFKEKKEIILAMARALSVCTKIHEIVNKSLQERKEVRYFEKQKETLQRDVKIFDSIQQINSEEMKITDEKKKELGAKQKEINKISLEIKKRKAFETEIIGIDAEDREYWIFAGDKEKIYIRTIESEKEVWRTYSTQTQIDSLLKALIDKGIAEKKLKSKLEQLIPKMQFIDVTKAMET